MGDEGALILAMLKYDVAPKMDSLVFGSEFKTGDINLSQKTVDSLGMPEMVGFLLPSMDVRIDKISADKFHVLCRMYQSGDGNPMDGRFFIEVSKNQDTVVSKTYYNSFSDANGELRQYSRTEKTAVGFEMDYFGDGTQMTFGSDSQGGFGYTKATGRDGTFLCYRKGYYDKLHAAEWYILDIFNGTNAIHIIDKSTETEPEAKIADSDGKVISNPSESETQLLNQYIDEFTTRMEQGVDFFAIKELPTDFDSKFDDPIFK